MRPTRKQDPTPEHEDVVLLEDLAPTRAVRGGANKLRFGQSPPTAVASSLPDEVSAAPRIPEVKPGRGR